MSQDKAQENTHEDTQAKTPAQVLDGLYAENLVAISSQQSGAACQLSLQKAERLQQKPSKTFEKLTTACTITESLKQLNSYLNHSATQQKHQKQPSFSEQADIRDKAQANPKGFVELQSKRAFLSMQQTTFANHVVQQAIDQGPENPGPLNPQQLAINALKNMRDLSPAYLSRYVNYVDSLFALEHTGKKLIKSKKTSKA